MFKWVLINDDSSYKQINDENDMWWEVKNIQWRCSLNFDISYYICIIMQTRPPLDSLDHQPGLPFVSYRPWQHKTVWLCAEQNEKPWRWIDKWGVLWHPGFSSSSSSNPSPSIMLMFRHFVALSFTFTRTVFFVGGFLWSIFLIIESSYYMRCHAWVTSTVVAHLHFHSEPRAQGKQIFLVI